MYYVQLLGQINIKYGYLLLYMFKHNFDVRNSVFKFIQSQ